MDLKKNDFYSAGDGILNVLDDILDSTGVDDELIAEINEDSTKPGEDVISVFNLRVCLCMCMYM